MTISSLSTQFAEIYQQQPTDFYFAPGRINLIGEHTDYNGGRVFPCAISLGTYAALKPRTDQTIRLYSVNFPEAGISEFTADQLEFVAQDWTSYPKGMFKFWQEHQHPFLHGFDILVQGNIPAGGGLSSSASIEMLFGKILTDQFQEPVDQLTLVKMGQEVENKFIGVQSGIMDQFAVGMGQAEQAILLDTNTLKYEMVPVHLQQYQIIIMNTNKKRTLADSKYNERRQECEEALKRLQTISDVTTLGALTKDEFDTLTYAIGDETLIKRARHAVFENQRTIQAVQALKNNQLQTFGHLMNASHISLEYDYEVTGIELDTLVHSAWQHGALGARMTGAGFGGCALALVAQDQTDNFMQAVNQDYQARIGYAADFYPAKIVAGPQKIH
ncbi:galactokinase [Bombilactobacillus bombi]|uniref:galactokinase n=1 Tax=Bombilactobacillus bombi TaxID=1303590 RepID=UPI00359C3BE4